jgi:hypothetical protein
MENWEFLLQKQGDKSWLPLESPTVEILEGEYRLASRTKFADALVGIQLRYIPISESIYKPSHQKIAKRVNPEGLLIVMPYTNFTPGIWRIECTELDDLEHKEPHFTPWLVCMQLEVQPISVELASDWHLNLQIPNLDDQVDLQKQRLDLNSPVPEPDITSEVDNPVIEAGEDRPELALAKFTLPVPDLAMTEESQGLEILNELPQTQVTEAISLPRPALPYNLIALNHSQYLVTEAQMPILSGTSFLPGELEVVLKNPQDLETVMHARFVLVASSDLSEPINFSFELNVPVQTSQVMIGEVRLHPSVEVVTDSQPHIYHQAIALTYQSQDILAEVAQEITTASQLQQAKWQSERFDASTTIGSTTQVDSEQTSSNLKLPKLPLESSPIRHTSEQTGTTKFTGAKLPELPRIAPLSATQSPLVQSDLNLDTSRSELLSEPEREILEETQPTNLGESTLDFELPYGFEAVSMYEADSFAEDWSMDNLTEGQTESLFIEKEAQPTITPQSPSVGDRFLDKLQAISRESINESLIEQQVSEFIGIEVEKLESEIDKSLGLEDLGNEFEQMLIADELLVALDAEIETETEPISISHGKEATFVTDVTQTEIPESFPIPDNPEEKHPFYAPVDEPESSISDALYEVLAASQVIDRSTANNSGVWSTLSSDRPVPLPILEIPEGEAISGVTFPILIKLPAIESKLFVKFWVKDCQTRNIIDGPRWLVDFQMESDADFMTARTPITLPLGTMEVAFEAIAVEMQTQRESRKTSTIRPVTLPNLVQDNDVDFDPP